MPERPSGPISFPRHDEPKLRLQAEIAHLQAQIDVRRDLAVLASDPRWTKIKASLIAESRLLMNQLLDAKGDDVFRLQAEIKARNGLIFLPDDAEKFIKAAADAIEQRQRDIG